MSNEISRYDIDKINKNIHAVQAEVAAVGAQAVATGRDVKDIQRKLDAVETQIKDIKKTLDYMIYDSQMKHNLSVAETRIVKIRQDLERKYGNYAKVRNTTLGIFWLQECKKQVFVVATANDVSMLPSELLRRGRFDELFFVDLPTADERRDILSMYMKKYLSLNFAGQLSDKIVEITEGFTGADLESTVRDLAYRRLANPNYAFNEENIITAFNNVVPLSQTSPERIEAIRDWGRERAVPASGRPIGSEAISADKSVQRTRKVLI